MSQDILEVLDHQLTDAMNVLKRILSERLSNDIIPSLISVSMDEAGELSVNSIISEGSVFHYVNKSSLPDFVNDWESEYTKFLKKVEIQKQINEIK
jgi:hypothetical protein